MVPEFRIVPSPPEFFGHPGGAVPKPDFKFGVNDDHLGAIHPSVSGKGVFNPSLDVFSGVAASTPLPVEHHKRASEPQQIRPQELNGSNAATRISIRVAHNGPLKRL
jgi:hypothetical protein